MKYNIEKKNQIITYSYPSHKFSMTSFLLLNLSQIMIIFT